uniref:Nephrocystin 4 n=2 Tax=Echeneis naucrates TaxID=173247 RepID=A0A665TCW4_ECHNA
MMHLLPENVIVSGDENIPGLAASPTGDALLRPQLLKMLPFTLNRLTISLQPSLEKFESQLLQLITADCHNTKQPGPEVTLRTVVILERRLHVGVHNGWCFLDKPQVVVVEPLASGARGRVDSTSRQSTLVKDSSAAEERAQVLGLRSSLELKMTNHQALAVVFQLEYVFAVPAGRETMLSVTTSSRAAFLQCLRWGIWCPFQEPADWKGEEIQLVLQGGAKPNPHGVMVYSTEMSAKTQSLAPLSAAVAAQVNDLITFRLSSNLERKASSPKASLRTKQENVSRQRRSPSSPSQSQRHIPPASPPDSPQGPGLSLSQLAATSRYPTISHSSSALPWQQSFPSLRQPSPLASAHQLSHVACSAVSNIAHLEMDLQQEGDVSLSAQNEGDHLQELPFTPVHAPVITLGLNVPSSSSVSSRSSLAHLYSAGFPEILDCSRQVAEVLDPTEPVPFDPQREETDLLQGNLLVFQFLAFTRVPTLGVGPDWPDNIYFTFQFYRFPLVTSQQLKLLTADKVQHKTNNPLPCVLASVSKDGTVNSDSPGLQVQFRVDEVFLKPGEKRWFLRYLALHTMHIDVWDSNSLLLIGSTAIELKYMLRQGKPAVQALHEVEVLTTNYVGEETLLTSAGLGRHSASGPMTVHTIVKGRLHVRTGNIGCSVGPGQRKAAGVLPSHSHIITPREVTSGFRGGSLSSRNIVQLNARNTAQARRLEIDEDRVPLFRHGIRPENKMPGEHGLNDPDGDRRKLDCMAAVHQRESKEGAKAVKVMDQTKKVQLAKALLQIKPSEERSKAESIANMLSQAITTQHLLYASLGSAEYMEFVLKNPFNVPQTVTIHSDDPELSVITDTDEWHYFKALTKTPTPLEENMFHLEEGGPGPKVYLRPKESVHIPLKYQSFLCDHTMALQGPSFLPAGKSSQVAKKNLSNVVSAKTIKVTFRGEDGKPMAICQVNVEPTPHVVDQTFRLYHPELTFLKKAIRLPPWHDPTVGDPDTRACISVRCSDPNIICQTRMLVPGEPQDVYLKVPGSPSPHIKMFFVMVFTDEWMAAPSQIWQIYVHFLERVDISCVTGQRTCQSLVLRGKQAVRKVKCFSSHPKEIEVDPDGVFVLPPAAVQELQLKVQPWQPGSRFLYVNAVDVENQRLVTAWLLCLNVHQPVLSKAFEVCVPVGSGRGSSRKITYTNPYTSSRTFLLRSDHPDLLQFKEDKFQISGRESYSIGLRFAPSQSSGSVEILVYVNNLEEKTEETFCVKVNYS